MTGDLCGHPNPRRKAQLCERPAGHTDRMCHHEDPDLLPALGYRATHVMVWPNPNATPRDPHTGLVITATPGR